MYNKLFWKDHLTNPKNTFKVSENADGTITLTPVGQIIQQGTSMCAENFNNIELGIFDSFLFNKLFLLTMRAHFDNTSNPHKVTPEQLGIVPKSTTVSAVTSVTDLSLIGVIPDSANHVILRVWFLSDKSFTTTDIPYFFACGNLADPTKRKISTEVHFPGGALCYMQQSFHKCDGSWIPEMPNGFYHLNGIHGALNMPANNYSFMIEPLDLDMSEVGFFSQTEPFALLSSGSSLEAIYW